MPRIFIILACATVLVFGWMFYQYQPNKRKAADLMLIKLFYLKDRADISAGTELGKLIEIDLSDARLKGDYKVMSDFILGQMLQRAEARNQYIRDLKL